MVHPLRKRARGYPAGRVARLASAALLCGLSASAAQAQQSPQPLPTCPSLDASGTPVVMIPGGSTFIRVFLDPHRATLEVPFELPAFCMHAVPVTQEKWNLAALERPAESRVTDDVLTRDGEPRPGHEQQPVTAISQQDAAAYCAALGGRLPTETEWEFAAAGGSAALRNAWTSADLVDTEGNPEANFTGENDGFEGLSPVTSFPVGHFGLYDMIGNAAEWTSSPEVFDMRDWARLTNPVHRSSQRMVFKGGSFEDDPTSDRRWEPRGRDAARADERLQDVGFRCVFEPSSR
jgi:formylglycine-generating enzyme required for sulfatase activity